MSMNVNLLLCSEKKKVHMFRHKLSVLPAKFPHIRQKNAIVNKFQYYCVMLLLLLGRQL